ncbi:MAG TPA: LuxR C-terminal-related transcriptional regulator, partial [Spongiibacteraceae bacterium]|nr:LuxR C-terminal-related transcriptional regulator [Spongiibacteraceae bacterium]
QGDMSASSEPFEQLCRLFKLSFNEAKLALALARGLSIAEAAQELDLTLETTRTYSKKIYAKVGARGQVDLVRIIHRSLLRLA